MPKKKTAPALPRLPPDSRDHTTVAALLETMREFALKSQRSEPQLFYSIRDTAKHFGVTPSSVSRAYQQLEEEGILVSVRGSKTLLQGSSSGRHLSVRGFIGLPGFTPAFVTLQDYRTFFIRIRRELRARGFAVATVFYNDADHRQNQLANRIEKYGFDTVIWHQPDRAARPVISRLQDAGIQVMGVRDRGFPSVRCRYEIQREAAITAILNDWKARSDVRSVIVVASPQASAAKEELLKTLLAEATLAFELKRPASDRVGEFLETLGQEEKTGIILPSQAAAICAFRAPEKLAQLMARARVAFTGGPTSIPFVEVPEVRADVVYVDWQLVAEKIVSDLISREAFDRREGTIFEATAQLCVSLSQHAERL